MKKTKLHLAWLWGLLLLITTSSCGNDDDYYYPSVKLEYVTVQADEDGRIHTLIPDKGEPLPVSEDRTASTILPNESKRVISNYETLSEGEQSTAVIYSIQALPTPKPQPADAPDFRDGIKTDPVDLVSIWMGKNYLNLILNVKADDKQHVFGTSAAA